MAFETDCRETTVMEKSGWRAQSGSSYRENAGAPAGTRPSRKNSVFPSVLSVPLWFFWQMDGSRNEDRV